MRYGREIHPYLSFNSLRREIKDPRFSMKSKRIPTAMDNQKNQESDITRSNTIRIRTRNVGIFSLKS